jgi:hypothetical protein
MFGSTGQYQIPNLEQVKRYLRTRTKPLDEVVDLIFPKAMPTRIKLKALSIMRFEKLLTKELLQAIAIKN